MSARTPQTRSQTARKTTGSITGRTAGASSGGKVSSVLEAISDPLLWTTGGTVAVLAVASYVVAKHHRSILKVPKAVQVSDRLVYALQQQTFALVPLLVALVHVMLVRCNSKARNPLSGYEKLVDKPVRILNNTVEQFILSAVNQLILATFLPADLLFVIPFLAYTFAIGRILFIIGYNIQPEYRTPGFLLGFLPSAAATVVNLLYATGLNKHVPLP
ncbi:hypothetical protein TYRP_018933 [Tyrophagus putrescentiae]|nr:hypothetical protein TYRP_018933 [Tyrophagus putrescentiae]